MKERKSFLLRIDPSLYEALEAWAQQEFRSGNGQIEYLLKEAARRRGARLEMERPLERPAEASPSGDIPQDPT